MLRYIFFDLDGTLLPMNQDVFTETYFTALTKFIAPLGYDPEKLVNGVWKGIYSMIKNDNRASNEEVFWKTFADVFGEKALEDKDKFNSFYETRFDGVKDVCAPTGEAPETVKRLKEKGYKLVLASNPIFPEIGQKNRMRWAGVNPDDFEYITSYENSGYSKPNPDYYRQILGCLGASPEECLMVGNDVNEDMAAEPVGMKVFLMTDCLLNKSAKDYSRYPQGGFADLLKYIDEHEKNG